MYYLPVLLSGLLSILCLRKVKSILFFFITALPSSNVGRSIPQLQYFSSVTFKYGAGPNCLWRSTISAFPCILIPRGFQGLMLSRSSTTRATLVFPPEGLSRVVATNIEVFSVELKADWGHIGLKFI
jgi:hypothetical protein